MEDVLAHTPLLSSVLGAVAARALLFVAAGVSRHRSRGSVSELLSCLCPFVCSAWIHPCLLTARQAHKMVEKEELET